MKYWKTQLSLFNIVTIIMDMFYKSLILIEKEFKRSKVIMEK